MIIVVLFAVLFVFAVVFCVGAMVNALVVVVDALVVVVDALFVVFYCVVWYVVCIVLSSRTIFCRLVRSSLRFAFCGTLLLIIDVVLLFLLMWRRFC